MITTRFTRHALTLCFAGLPLLAQTTASDPAAADELQQKHAAENIDLKVIQSEGHSGSYTITRDTIDSNLQKKTAEAVLIMSAGDKVVKNKPYSADAVTETVQVLGDGNRITRRSLVRQYRDSSGRMRREQTVEPLGGSMTTSTQSGPTDFVFDPISNTDFVVHPDSRSLMKIERDSVAGTASPGNVFFKSVRTQSGPSSALETVNVGQKEDLGKQTIEGLECAGTRTTSTIAANQIGNERPIVTVTESWYSTDLDAVVKSKTSDPRFGDTTYTLQNVLRAEPAAELFEVPAGFKVEGSHRAAPPPRP